MNNDLKQELYQLGVESAKEEKRVKEEWYMTHKHMGRDGGPVRELMRIRMEANKRYQEILKKYSD